jgi:serine phosphatase RsbU (regulator of sigma subunit)
MSGHGLEAASHSATIRSLFRGLMRDRADLTDAVERLNRVLVEELSAAQFATALAGTYSGNGQLSLVNAGHPLPIVCGEGCRMIEHVGLPLAVTDMASYEEIQVELKPGEVFVCYTDGLSEARVGANLFGEERVIETLKEIRDAPARSIAEHLRDKSLRHAEGKLMDDMAILVLKRNAG